MQIHRFETHCRVPYWGRSEQRRLENARQLLLDHAFEQALEACGVPEEAELCIRNLFVSVRVKLNDSDESISAQWSAALAAGIVEAVSRHATANAVFYHSRRHALMDMAINVARGELSRAWAWRQLGLWRSTDLSESQAKVELMRALSESAAMVVPVLRALAQEALFEEIIRRFTETDWQDLAAAALEEAGFAHLLNGTVGDTSPRALSDALRLLRVSRLLRAVTSSGSLLSAGEQTRRAVAALIVMEVEPGLLRMETSSTLVNLVANAISTTSNEAIAEAITSTTDIDDSLEAASATKDQGVVNPTSSRLAEAKAGTPENAFASERDSIADNGGTEATLPDQRRRAFTQFGGLLFLLSVIEELNLPEEILANTAFGPRSFVWVIHQLALTLLPMDSSDPAALAFAGLQPDTKPPSDGEDPPSENEAEALNALATSIVERLSSLLEFDHTTEESALEFVCHRRAEIVSDPGWLEIRFALDDGTTEIRRAGLDLNPGYIPWLGVVLVFAYE